MNVNILPMSIKERDCSDQIKCFYGAAYYVKKYSKNLKTAMGC